MDATPAQPGYHGDFPSTLWSDVERAGRADGDEAFASLSKLLLAYERPLLRHLAEILARRGISPDQAPDYFHDFVLNKILLRNLLARADRSRGRFRGFLIEALDNFVCDQFKRANSQKRSPEAGLCSLDEHTEVLPHPMTEDLEVGDWVDEVLEHTLLRMQQECNRTERCELWELFVLRVLNPILNGSPAVPYEQLVRKFNYPSPGAAAKALMQAKEIFRQCLRAEIGQFPGVNVEEEIRALRCDLMRRSGSQFRK